MEVSRCPCTDSLVYVMICYHVLFSGIWRYQYVLVLTLLSIHQELELSVGLAHTDPPGPPKQVSVCSYRYTVHTGILFIPVHRLYRYTVHIGIPFVLVHRSSRYTVNTGKIRSDYQSYHNKPLNHPEIRYLY